MKRLEVGDKVKVRKDLKNKISYGGIGFVAPMIQYIGKICRINGIDRKSFPTLYHIDIDEYGWNWTQEMFTGDIQLIIE